MADPLSMIATISALVSTCVTISNQAAQLKQRFGGAPAAIQGLIIDCTSTATVLQRLEALVERRPQLLAGGGNGATPGLKGSLDVLIDGIHNSINAVGYELTLVGSSLDDSNVNLGGGMSKRERAKFMWKEDVFKELMLDIREQRSTLTFLLDCVNTEALVNVQMHLEMGGGHHASSSSSAPASNAKYDPSQLNLQQLSIKPDSKRPRITCILPRILDRPDVLKQVARLRTPPGKAHRAYSSYDAEAIHSSVEKKDDDRLCRKLAGRRDPDICLPGSKLRPLFRAMSNGYDRGVFFLLAAGANLTEYCEEGFPPLTQAIREGCPCEIIKLMCELGADVHARCAAETGLTALHSAAANNCPEHIKALLSHGARIDEQTLDKGRWTALWFAVSSGSIAAASKLLDYGCDPNAENGNGFTPLWLAINKKEKANSEMVQLLCDRGANTADEFLGVGILSHAISVRCPESVVKAVTNAGYDINSKPSKGNTALISAIANDPELVPYLIERGADVNMNNSWGLFPIHAAVEPDVPISILKLLLKSGALVDSVNEIGTTPLTLAAVRDNLPAMKVLIDNGAYLDCENNDKYTPIGAAIHAKSTRAVKLLLESGADPEGELLDCSFKPIHMASFNGLDDIVKLFLEFGVDIESKCTIEDVTPIMMAAVGGRMSTVRLLMDSGADMYAVMKSGTQLLSQAVPHPAMLRFFLNHGGFDVNRQNSNGATVLHDTVMAGPNGIAAARILLQKGARQFHATICYEDAIDKETGIHSGTPADVARDMGKVELAELLESWKYT